MTLPLPEPIDDGHVDPDSLDFSGGAGGLDAQFDAVGALAASFDDLAERLSLWGAAATRTGVDPTLLASSVYSPSTFAAVEVQLGLLVAGPSSLGSNMVLWRATAATIRDVAQDLQDADESIGALADALQYGAGYGVGYGVGGILRLLGRDELLPEPGDDTAPLLDLALGGSSGGGGALSEWAMRNPEVFELLLGAGGGALEGLWDSDGRATPGFGKWALFDIAAAAAALARFYRSGHAAVDQVGGESQRSRAGSLEDLTRELDRVNELSPPDNPEGNGTIEIQRHGEGEDASYTVLVPGTDDLLTLPGEEDHDVRDAPTNLESLAGQPTAYSEGIAEAMRLAGITADSTVTIVGHSQGGIAALQVAASGEFGVQEVVTYGAPVGLSPELPDDVQVTSLENRSDLIPRLDGQGNPDRANHLTIDFDTRPETASQAHSIGAYTQGAAAVDASGDPSAKRTIEGLNRSGAIGGGTVSTSTYKITREFD